MTTRNERPRSASARGRVWLWVRRVLLALVGLILVLLLLGLLYQFVATRIAYRNYPAPGEMVSVSGHDMHLYCTGKAGGGPTVVMDSGLGGGVLDWQTVQPKVATFARVCSYDRSGIGWSESGQKPRTSRRIVEELHALLSEAGEEGPYVLVGHSFGGANVQLYASEYPKEVAGMVLVDSALDRRVLDEDLRTVNAPPSPLLIKATAPLGILRLVPSVGEESLPKRLAQQRSAIYNTTRHLYAVADESATVQESVAEATDAAPSLKEKPLVVLSAGARQHPSTKQAKRVDEQFNEFLASLTDLSENSELVVAENSAHYIHFDRPELVVDSIRQERAQELKADTRRTPRADKAGGESDVLAKIAEMPQPDRAMAERVHEIIKASAPELSPKTWYGMPAYAKDGKVVCFFQSAEKFNSRYATFSFSDEANLDEGAMWPTSYALKELTGAEEAKISALVKRAVS